MLEEVARAIKSHLESDLADQLDAIETYWSAKGAALTLPDPTTFVLGLSIDIVDYPRDSLPVVVTGAQLEGPSGEHQQRGTTMADQTDQWGYGEGDVLATIFWWVDADTAENAAMYGWRYAKAIHRVLKDHEKLDTGIRQENYVPRVEVDPPKREFPDTGAYFWTVMGQMEFAVKVRHV